MPKPAIYDAFDRAFARVNAFAILRDGRAVGRVAVKYPRDGMGRATFYLQSWGLEMVKGSASGCGYDKTTAAAYSAGVALKKVYDKAGESGDARLSLYGAAIAHALMEGRDGGRRWSDRLEAAGFDVATVI